VRHAQRRRERAIDAVDRQRAHQLGHDRAFPGGQQQLSEAVGRDVFVARESRTVVEYQFGQVQCLVSQPGLDAPIAVVGARNWITPCAEMEEDFFPQPEWILDTIHERVLPLPGHTPTTNQGIEEMQRRNARGV